MLPTLAHGSLGPSPITHQTEVPDGVMSLSILPPSQPLILPSFTSTLITGPLPSSAALHLAISHLSGPVTSKRIPQESTVIFTPSPDLYETERGTGVQLSVDEWIENHGLHGEHAHKLTRTHILYANTLSYVHIVLKPTAIHSTVSTPHQLAAHLALWNHPTSSDPSSRQRGCAGVNPSSTSLVILHNLSLLFPAEGSRNPFLRDAGKGGTLLSLVVQVLAWGGSSKCVFFPCPSTSRYPMNASIP